MKPSSSPACPLKKLGGLKILVVDDEPDTAGLLSFALEEAGADVRSAGSITEALSVLSGFTPDVITTDVHLPDGDGYRLLTQLQVHLVQTGQWQIPVIAVSGFPEDYVVGENLCERFQAYLVKPVDLTELIDLILQVTHQIGD